MVGATGEPELKFAQSGMAWCRFTGAASSRKKNDAGEWVDDKTLFMPVTCFRDTAEHVAESVAKGDLVLVIGRIHTDEWEDQTSHEKRSRIVMIADAVGPSLQFRNIPHQAGRTERSSSGPAADDPWASGPASSDSPPF